MWKENNSVIEPWKTQKPERSENQNQDNEWVKNNSKQSWEKERVRRTPERQKHITKVEMLQGVENVSDSLKECDSFKTSRNFLFVQPWPRPQYNQRKDLLIWICNHYKWRIGLEASLWWLLAHHDERWVHTL